MCGICGILDFNAPTVAPETLTAMTQQLHHRGPDDHGTFRDGPVGLGQTRLSIIDLTQAGHQPMQSEDGQVTLVYNGEVYNFQALRQRLEKAGATFRGRSDTEVILQAYLHGGIEAVKDFNGMFAFAIWDARTQTLHLARDRYGIKPLYIHRWSGGLVFGSEIKALLPSQRIARTIDPAGLHEFMYYGNALGERTLWAEVQKVPPATYLTCTAEGTTAHTYWQLEEVPAIADSEADATRTVQERLEAAVRAQLVSDVPVGVFLSGGIDSSCLTAFASKHYEGTLQTFSVGYDFEGGVNELPKARFVAEHFGTDHHELHIAGGNLPEVIEHLVQCHDEPFTETGNIPLYLLCRELGGSPKVILQGDGGDEFFAGYRRYNVLAANTFWQWAAPVAGIANALTTGGPGKDRRGRFFEAMAHRDDALKMAMLLSPEVYSNPPTRIFSGTWLEALRPHDPFARYRALNQRFAHLDRVQRMLYTDASILLPDTYLEKVDKPTMAFSTEVRVPMLDQPLTDYVIGLPSSYKVRRGQKKWLLRKALRGVVPDRILDAPKTGFCVPTAHWMRTSLSQYLRETLLDTTHHLFDRETLSRHIEEHIAGIHDHDMLLWKALNLTLWCAHYHIET